MFAFMDWYMPQVRRIIAVGNWLARQVARVVALASWVARRGLAICALYGSFKRIAAFVAILFAWSEFWVKFEMADPLTDSLAWVFEDVQLLSQWFWQDYVCPHRFAWYSLLAFISAYGIALGTMLILRICLSYLGYLALGRGARPPTVGGWLRHQSLKVIVNAFRIDVLSKPSIDPYEEPYNGRLLDLPERTQPRPQILGLGPIKQATETNRHIAVFFERVFAHDLARTHPDTLQSVRGERTGLPTLQLNLEPVPAPRRGATNTWLEWGGEIAHVRPDGGLQVTLHPVHADEVVRRGWGQRDALAVMNESWLWRFFYHWVLWRSTPVPSTSVIVYAPLDQAARDVVVRIVEAGVWWAELRAGRDD